MLQQNKQKLKCKDEIREFLTQINSNLGVAPKSTEISVL